MSTRLIEKIVKNYCEKNNILLESLSSDWILKLTDKGKIRYIYGYQFDLNSAGTLSLCNDKSATCLILNNLNIPCAYHKLFIPPFNEETVVSVTDFFNTYKKVVCKVNNGTGGKDVYLVSSAEQLLEKVKSLFDKESYVSLCPYYEITNEYRVIILNDEIRLIYSKERKNSWKHNLGLGAEPVIVTDEALKNILSKLALIACRAVNGKFVAVDIIDVLGDYKVLEINSGIMMEKFASKSSENYKIAENIYNNAIDSMLK